MKLASALLLVISGLVSWNAIAQHGGDALGHAAWAIHYDPKTLDPAKVDDQASEYIRYLTAGVLVRLNRNTMKLEPELAEAWQVSQDGKTVTIRLRRGLRFSDGRPLTSTDVAASLRRVLLPTTAAPVADEFVQPDKVQIRVLEPFTIELLLPNRLVQVVQILDEIAIEPAGRPSNAQVTSGPYYVSEYRSGQYIRLRRNEFYWKKDGASVALPYLKELRLDILESPETEELRFLKGQYALLDNVGSDAFDPLSRKLPGAFHDLGPSLNTEQMWFNQAPNAPLPAYEKTWFTSKAFRTAISLALHRADIARIAYNGHAKPANGFISPANKDWYDQALLPVHEDVRAAETLLRQNGFSKQGSQLLDRDHHPVRFSLLTNAGNRSRQKMASLIQQDLGTLGIQVNVITLDFPALIERLMHTQDYEAALLGLGNVQPDPSAMMNVWLSSSPNHQWNPSEPKPATPWEAAIDREMRIQAQSSDMRVRKAALSTVQRIVADELPFIYLVYPNTLCAVSPALSGVTYSVLQPDVTSTIETLHWRDAH